jgi:hypothetical protein
MSDAYREFEAQSLFCARCRRAVEVRKRLLLVLPTGNKYDYVCSVCGMAVGGKVDNDPTTYRETSRAAIRAARTTSAPSTGRPRPESPAKGPFRPTR